MENQQKFLELIRNPWELNPGTLSFLEKMAAEHPYCQSLQILLAKNLQPHDKLAFEKQVNKASAYTIDRRKFQRYISDRDKPLQEILSTVETSPPNTPTLSEDFVLPGTMPAETPTEQPTDKHIGPSAEKEASMPQENKQKHVMHSSEWESELEESEDQPTQKYSAEQEETIHPHTPVTPIEEEPLHIPNLQAPQSPTTQSLLDIVKQRLREIREKSKPNTRISKTLSPTQPIPSKKVEEHQKEPIITGEPPAPLDAIEDGLAKYEEEKPASTAPSDNISAQQRPTKKPDINFLIDKFLKEEPRIKVSKDLPEEQEDLSAPSSADDSQLITETLALVYLKQGQKDKALDVYEKLCLKFPEKSSYFAKKIIDINNEINS